MKSMHHAAKGFLLAGAVLAAACGKGSDTDAAKVTSAPPSTTAPSQGAATTTTVKGPPSGGVCGLLTSAEVEKAVGKPVAAPQRQTAPPEKGWEQEGCGYLVDPANKYTGASITLSSKAGGITSAEFNQRIQDLKDKSSLKKVNGVGDEAFLTTGPVTRLLAFRKGPKVAQVSLEIIIVGAQTSTDERLLELGRLAAGRL